MHGRSPEERLKNHLATHGIQVVSKQGEDPVRNLDNRLSAIQATIAQPERIQKGRSKSSIAEAFKSAVALVEYNIDLVIDGEIRDHVEESKAQLLKKQIREWVVVEFTRAYFRLQNQSLADRADPDFLKSASFDSADEEKPAVGTSLEKPSLLQRIRLTIALRSALELPLTVKPATADTILAEFNSESEARKFQATDKHKHEHLLSNLPLSVVSFVNFFEPKQKLKSRLKITTKPKTGFERPQPSFFSRLQKIFNNTFYVVDEENKERSFIHYFLGVPKRKDLLSPGWSTFLLAWDVLFYVAGMWLIAPLKNIVKLGIEFFPQAAARTFFSLASWMDKKHSKLGYYVFGGLGFLFTGVWLVGRALISPLTSLKSAIKKGEELRKINPILGWFATILLVGISAAISLAGIASVAAVSSIFFPAVAGAVVGEELAAAVPAIAPPVAAAAAGVLLTGDQTMQSTANECFGSTARFWDSVGVGESPSPRLFPTFIDGDRSDSNEDGHEHEDDRTEHKRHGSNDNGDNILDTGEFDPYFRCPYHRMHRRNSDSEQ